MKARIVNNMLGEMITLEQACALLNLGRGTIRRLASECGAARKIGKSYRIKRTELVDYIDKKYTD